MPLSLPARVAGAFLKVLAIIRLLLGLAMVKTKNSDRDTEESDDNTRG
jgi:hypothetical protein